MTSLVPPEGAVSSAPWCAPSLPTLPDARVARGGAGSVGRIRAEISRRIVRPKRRTPPEAWPRVRRGAGSALAELLGEVAQCAQFVVAEGRHPFGDGASVHGGE